MWQTKYPLAKNLGLGFDFRPCCEGKFPHKASVVHDLDQDRRFLTFKLQIEEFA